MYLETQTKDKDTVTNVDYIIYWRGSPEEAEGYWRHVVVVDANWLAVLMDIKTNFDASLEAKCCSTDAVTRFG